MTRTCWLLGILALTAILTACSRAEGNSLHLLFWQQSDIRAGDNVGFRVHPFSDDRRMVLLAADANRENLWYWPTDAIPTDNGIRVYYRLESNPAEHFDQRTWRMGILRNGEFTLPDLKLFPQRSDCPANVVLRRSPREATWGGFNVFGISRDAEGAYDLLYWDQPEEGPAGGMLAHSPDGIHWTKEPRKAAVFTEHNDAFTLLRRGDADYLLYQTRLREWPDKPISDNISHARRVISLRRSPDLITWTDQQVILEADEMDAPTTEFYYMNAFPYADRYEGLLMKYYADPSKPGKHSDILRYELVFSKDAENWERPYRNTDIGAFSCADPFVYQGDLCIVAHHEGGIVLYRTREDGLVSCGTEGRGSFCTQPFLMPNSPLLLNADSRQGSIGVEVLDENGLPVDGYSAETCRIKGKDGTRLPLTWLGKTGSELAGRKVHLRFILDNARVFSLAAKG